MSERLLHLPSWMGFLCNLSLQIRQAKNFGALQQLSPRETPASGNSFELETGCLRSDFQSGALPSPRRGTYSLAQDRGTFDFFIHYTQTCEETLPSTAKTDKAVPSHLGVLPDQAVNRYTFKAGSVSW